MAVNGRGEAMERRIRDGRSPVISSDKGQFLRCPVDDLDDLGIVMHRNKWRLHWSYGWNSGTSYHLINETPRLVVSPRVLRETKLDTCQ